MANIDHLEEHARAVVTHLRTIGVEFAVVGGIAVSLRTVERFTKDVDFAVSVIDDREAEFIVRSLSQGGFRIANILERDDDGRLSTVRLMSGGEVSVYVDLLFASSGIENEVISGASVVEIFADLPVKVASTPALIAMKLLSADFERRPQDIIDLRYLIGAADKDEIRAAYHLVDLITERKYNRNKNLRADLDGYLA